jgi:hypothetical protein
MYFPVRENIKYPAMNRYLNSDRIIVVTVGIRLTASQWNVSNIIAKIQMRTNKEKQFL